MNKHKNDLKLYKDPIFRIFFFILILPGKGDAICRKIVKGEYFTFVRF